MGNIYIIKPIAERVNLFGVFFVLNVNEIDITGRKKLPHFELMEVIGQRHKMFNYLRKEFL